MKTFIFCENNKQGWLSFYMVDRGHEYYLFSQRYHIRVADFFTRGVSLDKALDPTRCHKNSTIAKTMSRLPIYIRDVEEEYGIAVLDKTRRKKNRISTIYEMKCA